MRRSISTNRPDSGRFDQSELAVTWKNTSWPSPRLAAVTSGVPSLSRAHTLTSGPSAAGSASTWLLTSTSALGVRPANRLSSPKAASGCGCGHDMAPPSVRVPKRRAAGSRSSPPFSRRGPAKRTSTPPFFTHCVDALLDLARQRADVGQHQHRDVALDQAVDGGGQIGVLALGDLRERRSARSM